MRKIWVDDLSLRSKNLFKELAKYYDDMDNEDIEIGISSKVEDLGDNERLYGFRHCKNPHCKEFFQSGYLTEDDMKFCTKTCAETINADIVEEDYGKYIWYTEWKPEV